jgi:hypothetical protein
MAKLTNERASPDAGKDGERCSLPYCHCAACQAFWQSSRPSLGAVVAFPTGPFTWLQGHPYCEVCYPKMVAVLEADARLAMLRPMAFTYSGPFKVSEEDAKAIRRAFKECAVPVSSTRRQDLINRGLAERCQWPGHPSGAPFGDHPECPDCRGSGLKAIPVTGPHAGS